MDQPLAAEVPALAVAAAVAAAVVIPAAAPGETVVPVQTLTPPMDLAAVAVVAVRSLERAVLEVCLAAAELVLVQVAWVERLAQQEPEHPVSSVVRYSP